MQFLGSQTLLRLPQWLELLRKSKHFHVAILVTGASALASLADVVDSAPGAAATAVIKSLSWMLAQYVVQGPLPTLVKHVSGGLEQKQIVLRPVVDLSALLGLD